MVGRLGALVTSQMVNMWKNAMFHRELISKAPSFGFTRLFTSSTTLKADVKGSSSEQVPKNLLDENITAHKQTTLGRVYDKKPFKILLEAKKNYSWCTCGWSKNQPFCDGTHKNPYVQITLRPVKFQVEEKKEYFLCNCKQTAHRPFCDGAHKRLIDTQDPPKA